MAAKPRHLTQFARQMRREPTAAERRMWGELSDWRVPGLRFRRQFVIGEAIVDFACPRARLVLEIDGWSHEGREVLDARREAWLASEGWQVVRASNSECLDNARGVAEWFVRLCCDRVGSPFFAGDNISSG